MNPSDSRKPDQGRIPPKTPPTRTIWASTRTHLISKIHK